ncbi:MAG TPA: hypothetical protein VH331_13865 [Allosphingosinicella sp.]|jgi:hypothetical protein|nr:hypothetical protein [Allosphingosinicella sp.]
MDLLCRTGRHSRTSESPVWNNGYWFSTCERCGCDLIRRGGGRWRAPPKGLKVVWKPRDAAQIDWNGLIATRPARAEAPAAEAGTDQLPA